MNFALFTTRRYRPAWWIYDFVRTAAASHACNRAIVLYRRVVWSQNRPTALLAWRSIYRQIRSSVRSIIYVAARRCHLRSSVEYNAVNPAMTCMSLTRDLQWHCRPGTSCSPIGCRCWDVRQSIINQLISQWLQLQCLYGLPYTVGLSYYRVHTAVTHRNSQYVD